MSGFPCVQSMRVKLCLSSWLGSGTNTSCWSNTSLDVAVKVFCSCDEHLQSIDFKKITFDNVGGPHLIN